MEPLMAISMGDPAGVGPEILLRAAAEKRLPKRCLAVGDLAVLRYAARTLDIPIQLAAVEGPEDIQSEGLSILDAGCIQAEEEFAPGQLSGLCGDASWQYIHKAASLVLNGRADALVTLPVSKEAVQIHHPGFTGHTEMIAEMCGQQDYTMMLHSDKLTVTHVSTHISMLDAVRAVTRERVLRVLQLTDDALRQGAFRPRMAVAGLNAHAGEHGLFGMEEILHIQPAIQSAREQGMDASGPYPPDTIFRRAAAGEFDAVVCMYHDQGHIPLKLLDFHGGVNVTLGLSMIRTSVDHGTAFDIAYQGIAEINSFCQALDMAGRMAAERKSGGNDEGRWQPTS